MNRQTFYRKRSVYRLMKHQDDHEWGMYASREQGKFWSGMEVFEPLETWRKGAGRWYKDGKPQTMQEFYALMKKRYIDNGWPLEQLHGIIARGLKNY